MTPADRVIATECLESLRALIRESGVKLVTAVQVPNPHARVHDIGASWDPLTITIDYMNILS